MPLWLLGIGRFLLGALQLLLQVVLWVVRTILEWMFRVLFGRGLIRGLFGVVLILMLIVLMRGGDINHMNPLLVGFALILGALILFGRGKKKGV
jgi:LPXTG-motif cell wall-anchored protein